MFNKNSSEIISGYFGKLPEFNDFIKYNAGSSEILYIDNWLQEGLAQTKLKYKEEWKEKYHAMPPTGFFIPIPSSQKIAAGMLYPGKDKSGREFPFIIFSLITGKLFDLFYLMPAELEHNLSMLDEILRKEEDLSSLNNALKNYKATLPPKGSVNTEFQQYLSGSFINEFLTRTGLGNIKENIKDKMFHDNSVIRISFGTDDSHFRYDAGFLIYLLQKRISLSFRHSSVFWNSKQDGKYQMIIFPLKLTSLNFIDLLRIDCNDERIIEYDSAALDSGYLEANNLTSGDYLNTF